MARFTDPRKLARYQRSRSRKVVRSLKIEQRNLMGDMRAEAIRLTSGNIPLSVFKALGHPLGRGGRSLTKPFRSGGRQRKARVTGRGSVPLLPINRQSGRGQRSLRIVKRGDAYRLFFTDPGINYRIRGTSKMVPSGFFDAMKRLYNYKKRRLLKAKQQAEKG